MGSSITSLRIDDPAVWGRVYGVRGDTSLYLLDLRSGAKPRVMRLPGFDSPEYAKLDRRWWRLLGVYVCGPRGNQLVDRTVKVGIQAVWEPDTPNGQGWRQTPCVSIRALTPEDLDEILRRHGLDQAQRLTKPGIGEGAKGSVALSSEYQKSTKAVCSACGKSIPLARQGGVIAVHLTKGGKPCLGAGKPPVSPPPRKATNIVRKLAGPRTIPWLQSGAKSGSQVGAALKPATGKRVAPKVAPPAISPPSTAGRPVRVPHKCKGCGRMTTFDAQTGKITSHVIPRTKNPGTTCDRSGLRLSKAERRAAVQPKKPKSSTTHRPPVVDHGEVPLLGRHGSVQVVSGGLPTLGRRR